MMMYATFASTYSTGDPKALSAVVTVVQSGMLTCAVSLSLWLQPYCQTHKLPENLVSQLAGS